MYCLIWVIGITFYTHFLIRYTSAASEAPMLLKTWLVVGYAVVVAACATAIVSLQNFFQCVSDGYVDPSDSECKRALRFFYVSCGLYGLVYAVDFLLALSHLLKRRAVNAGGYSQV
ncbi:hypothetical protein PTSG_02822 [Salpingoeca rosetta]|uniref:Uncharacterized protein n=1 Tax=Salpingoeca rosetta (strain ATCC 50818 / BSB-021) TaxID=946362 RepID=F2U3F4_SALR5|nr:uncharacterized protein PTSG_02822 [Salpingoeca rosetta]EGD82148.1 hypothetical protein PTSG_02822 [Salpingoeca rosetta]|eukprot:XP_004996331.1 hypothetical protein PTSG_02822 [Salpingoeca rosetta]